MQICELTTGQPFFYGGYGGSLGMISNCYRMLDPIDQALLQKACDLVLPRFPYFRAKSAVLDGRYVIVPNDAPFEVFRSDKPIPPGSERANGHLITVGCIGYFILLNYFHGLTDVRGLLPFTKALLAQYCQLQYGEALSCPGLAALDEAPLETEYADPFRFVEPNEDGLPVRDVDTPFLLPEARIQSGRHQKMYPIIMPQNTFLRFTRNNDASPAVMAALLLARAIEEVHPEHREPICVTIPVDFRGMIGHTEIHQNGICPIMLQYTSKMRGLPLETQATMFRGQVFLKSDPPTVMNRVCETRAFAESVTALPTLADKVSAYHTAWDVPVVSYGGRTDWGGISDYMTQMYMIASADSPGININIFHVGSNLEFSIMVGTESDAYYEAFIHQLNINNVHYYYGRPVSFVPMKREF